MANVTVQSFIDTFMTAANTAAARAAIESFDPTMPGAIGGTTPSTGQFTTITLNNGGSTIVLECPVNGILGVDGDIQVSANLFVLGAVVRMANLPTSDPASNGQLWNNSGVVTVSSG